MTSTVTIVGNLTRDPELRYTPNGAAVATFGVAVNRRWQNRDNQQWEEATSAGPRPRSTATNAATAVPVAAATAAGAGAPSPPPTSPRPPTTRQRSRFDEQIAFQEQGQRP
jgi:hypothetical protein